jgi:hypothetical protein
MTHFFYLPFFSSITRLFEKGPSLTACGHALPPLLKLDTELPRAAIRAKFLTNLPTPFPIL